MKIQFNQHTNKQRNCVPIAWLMFVLTRIKDSIRITPDLFDRDEEDVLRSKVEEQYCNRVIPDCGLVVSLWEIEKLISRYIYPGDGSAHVQCVFLVLVFCPFVGEMLTGVVKDVDKDGVTLDLGFFQDLRVPSYNFPQPCVYRSAST